MEHRHYKTEQKIVRLAFLISLISVDEIKILPGQPSENKLT